MKISFLLFNSVKIFFCYVYTHTRSKTIKIFFQTFRWAIALWKSWVCKYSIRFQVIKVKLLCETLKNKKILLEIQTKYGNITNEVLNVAIDVELTFKCKWPNFELLFRTHFQQIMNVKHQNIYLVFFVQYF